MIFVGRWLDLNITYFQHGIFYFSLIWNPITLTSFFFSAFKANFNGKRRLYFDNNNNSKRELQFEDRTWSTQPIIKIQDKNKKNSNLSIKLLWARSRKYKCILKSNSFWKNKIKIKGYKGKGSESKSLIETNDTKCN